MRDTLIYITVFVVISLLIVIAYQSYITSSYSAPINLEKPAEYEAINFEIKENSYIASYKNTQLSNADLEALLVEFERAVTLMPQQTIALSFYEQVEYTTVLETLEFFKTKGFVNVQIESND